MSDKEFKYTPLSDDAASKLLANVFDSCSQEPNTIPLDMLKSYSEYRRERFSLQKIVLIIILIIFCLLPLCFISPNFTLTPSETEENAFLIDIASRFPVRVVSAALNGHSSAVYQESDRQYSVEPRENGTLRVRVTLLNGQYIVKEVDVTGIDNDVPVLIDSTKTSNQLWLTVSDEGSGIDYSGVRMETVSGGVIYPDECDTANGVIKFPFPDDTVNIYIPDFKGNTLQLVLTLS